MIVLSSVGQEDMVVNTLKLGAADYITKPFFLNEFTVRIEKILNS